jgi:hypothetical protein
MRLRRSYTVEFEEFWAAYPVEGRHDKPKAAAEFERALKRVEVAEIVGGARRYRDDPNRDSGKTKYAQGWLSGDRWNDPLIAASNGNGRGDRIGAWLAEQEALDG